MLYEYKFKVMKVTDGDTIQGIVDLGWGVPLGFEDKPKTWRKLRLSDINAYETTLRYGQTQAEKELGLEAKRRVKEWLEGKWVFIRTMKDEKGSFERMLACVWEEFTDDGPMGDDVGTRLLDLGLAVPYEG